jgi:cyclopropane-fatty-acyl-phospholipid synthase
MIADNKFQSGPVRSALMWYMRWVETGWVPDVLIRVVMRVGLNCLRLRRYAVSQAKTQAEKRALINKLIHSPIAIRTDDPNVQHYDVPSEFFQLILGKWLKYSCCYWPTSVTNLDDAEEAMLTLTCQRARLEDGMQVLDLGCGWGSLSLWIGTNYPNCQVLAVSNSNSQREFIQNQCKSRGLENVKAMTANLADFEDDSRFDQRGKFDRVISIEMFEHMKNYERLLKRIASLLEPEGKLFVHLFSNRQFVREFDAEDPKDWMAQTFFSGGTMPSDDLLLYFQGDLKLIDHWRVDGWHYEKTLNAWLAKLDSNKGDVRRVIAQTYGAENETRWLANWRLFFLACSEVWGTHNGREYLVSHYLFERRESSSK